MFSAKDNCPAIGGCVELSQPHSEHILTSEVVLFEPSIQEMFANGIPLSGKNRGNRLIFLNTPLTGGETDAMVELHEALHTVEGSFPKYVHLQALRLLQFEKFNVEKTVKLIQTHLTQRVGRLPIHEASVLEDLKRGFMYWHGRDRKCRPCLVIRIENMGELKNNKDRAVQLVIFVLEYCIRYAMVPGRVENWVVIIDLANATQLISFTQMIGLVSTAKAIATTLEAIYCGRMVWVKLLHLPGMLQRPVQGVIPAEKAKKVCVVRDNEISESLLREFEPNQLEQRFGGTAPDLKPSETYPFKFFPDCTGPGATTVASLHEVATRSFHEGQLWDASTPDATKRWVSNASVHSLTPLSAAVLSEMPGVGTVKPVTNMNQWHKVVDPDYLLECAEEEDIEVDDEERTTIDVDDLDDDAALWDRWQQGTDARLPSGLIWI